MKKAPLSGIYAITNTANGKHYVGSAINIPARWRAHIRSLGKGAHHSRHLQASWNKYGKDAFEFLVIERVDQKDKLLEREQFWIDHFSSASTGYNICAVAGSQLGRKHSAASREKMSASRLGKKHSAEHKASISAGQKGRICSAETARKIGDANKGKKLSAASREKMSAARKGRKMPPEAVAKAAASRVGVRLSPEHRANISAARVASNAARLEKDPNALKQSAAHVAKREAARMETLRLKRALGFGYKQPIPAEMRERMQ